MEKALEERVVNAVMVGFAGQGQKASKPKKSYMAIGNSIPKVGEQYKCKRLEKNADGELIFYKVTTSVVQEVKNMAGNVFIVTTMNSYYVTRVLYMPIENVHFAIVKNEPQIGTRLSCYKLEFTGEDMECLKWKTSIVQGVKQIHGLYRVTTMNSVYVCFPLN